MSELGPSAVERELSMIQTHDDEDLRFVVVAVVVMLPSLSIFFFFFFFFTYITLPLSLSFSLGSLLSFSLILSTQDLNLTSLKHG